MTYSQDDNVFVLNIKDDSIIAEYLLKAFPILFFKYSSSPPISLAPRLV